MFSPRCCYLLPALCVMLWAGSVYAYDDSPFMAGGSTALDLGHYSTAFSYPNGDHEAHVDRYGLTFAEPVGDDFHAMLVGGYLALSVDGDPIASAQDYSGRFLGLMGRYESTEGDYLNFSAALGYTWHDVNGASAFAPSEIQWYETWAEAGPVLSAGPWRFVAGGYLQSFDGNETDGGAANQFRRFTAGNPAGAYAGIVYYLDRTGSVGLYGMSGARQGVSIVFKREF
ncbi:MAG TPA: hypothetical protein VFK21_11100 [Gammaproteobacteria bacterium]|nr:hypothetical protein [Gammaproteobacteria bacterium]